MIPIIIGGTGRSGTCVLKRVLACHSKIVSIPTELRIIVDPDGALDLKSALADRWSPYNADHAIQRFRKLLTACESTNLSRKIEWKLLQMIGGHISPKSYSRWHLGQFFGMNYYRKRTDSLINELSYYVTRGSWIGSPSYQIPARIYEANYFSSDDISRILRNFFHDLFRHRAGNGQQTHWIDDTPYNIVHAKELLELFPNMRLIHIYRDFRDVLASYRKFSWGGNDPVSIARRLSNIVRCWFKLRESIPSSAYFEIALEKLAASPVACLKEICEFIDLDFDESLEKSIERIQTVHVHTGRWEYDLSKVELKAALPYLSSLLEAYGYDL